MTPHERLTNFRNELATLCEKYDIEINTECGCRIGANPGESSLECVIDFCSDATPNEIRNTPIQ